MIFPFGFGPRAISEGARVEDSTRRLRLGCHWVSLEFRRLPGGFSRRLVEISWSGFDVSMG
jgi:hypothetical protein